MSDANWRYGPARRRVFWPWPVGLFLVLCAAGAAGLFWLWGALERYEYATPEAAILRCVQAVQAGQELPDVPRQLLPGRFATADQYADEARALLADLPADRDRLRFVKKAQEEQQLDYLVVDEEQGRVEFLLLPQGDGWAAWPRVEPLAAVTIQAPADVALSLDGLPLGSEELASESPVPGFEALGEAAPRLCQWRVEGLLEPPELTAQSEAGSCRVTWETPLRARVTVEPDADTAASLERFFENAARVYARYVSADASFAELSGLLVRDTDLYENLRTFDSSWYVSHDAVAFEELEVSALESFGPDAASGTVTFTYVVSKEGLRPRSYPSKYRMHAIRDEQGWRLLDLEVL